MITGGGKRLFRLGARPVEHAAEHERGTQAEETSGGRIPHLSLAALNEPEPLSRTTARQQRVLEGCCAGPRDRRRGGARAPADSRRRPRPDHAGPRPGAGPGEDAGGRHAEGPDRGGRGRARARGCARPGRRTQRPPVGVDRQRGQLERSAGCSPRPDNGRCPGRARASRSPTFKPSARSSTSRARR